MTVVTGNFCQFRDLQKREMKFPHNIRELLQNVSKNILSDLILTVKTGLNLPAAQQISDAGNVRSSDSIYYILLSCLFVFHSEILEVNLFPFACRSFHEC